MAAGPDDLRAARDSYTIAFRQLIRLASDRDPPLICVVEGKDAGYYHPRVHYWMVSHAVEMSLEFINSSGRTNVLKIRKAVDDSEALDGILCMYFLDRDVNPPANDGSRDDTYVTDGYSVENLYASTNAVKAIINHHCFGNSTNDPARNAVEEAINRYVDLSLDFVQSSLLLNAWVLAQRRAYGVRAPLRTLDKKSYVNVSIDGKVAELLIKKGDLDALPEPHLHPTADQLSEAEAELEHSLDLTSCRGKQVLFFVICFLEDFIQSSSKKGSACFAEGCAAIQIPTRTFLTDFSQFADTPPSLLNFFEAYYRTKVAA